MAENKQVEEIQDWIFTWGYSQLFPNCYIKIRGTQASSRESMFEKFGPKWSMQYPECDEQKLRSHGLKELKAV